jgi:A/G-specific adenine glycosylase
MPWRSVRTPYRVLLSECMLQQTQVSRVLTRFPPFIRRFPSFRALSTASVRDVVEAWKGLGYNRRALALAETARIVTECYRGRLPRSVETLARLPGIGPATAAAIVVYAYDLPVAFIETNIRRVFIHFFFPDAVQISDRELMPCVEQALDRQQPREWHYALMDYGAMLGKRADNPNRRGASYHQQAAFEGSLRQIRGRVLEVMLALELPTAARIAAAISELQGRVTGKPARTDPRLPQVLQQLVEEGFLSREGSRYRFR